MKKRNLKKVKFQVFSAKPGGKHAAVEKKTYTKDFAHEVGYRSTLDQQFSTWMHINVMRYL